MASSAPRLERRRGQRVLGRIPVTLSVIGLDDRDIQTAAEAIEVNYFGALLRSPLALGLGSTLELMNPASQQTEEFRVVQIKDEKVDGLFEIGVEILHLRPSFWGIQLPEPTPV